jgi:hypothetical protein
LAVAKFILQRILSRSTEKPKAVQNIGPCALGSGTAKGGFETQIRGFRDPRCPALRSFAGVIASTGICACSAVAARLLLPQALVLLVVGEDEAALEDAALHARVARQVIDLGAQVVQFVRTTP